jgi:hypothetical protein
VLVSVSVTYSQCAGHAGLVAKGNILTHRRCSRWLAILAWLSTSQYLTSAQSENYVYHAGPTAAQYLHVLHI